MLSDPDSDGDGGSDVQGRRKVQRKAQGEGDGDGEGEGSDDSGKDEKPKANPEHKVNLPKRGLARLEEWFDIKKDPRRRKVHNS